MSASARTIRRSFSLGDDPPDVADAAAFAEEAPDQSGHALPEFAPTVEGRRPRDLTREDRRLRHLTDEEIIVEITPTNRRPSSTTR